MICNNNKFNLYFKNNLEIPCNNGISNHNNDVIIPYNIIICLKCGIPQLKYLGDLKIIYDKNHNNSVISKTWSNHYDFFCKFIIDSKIINNNNIIEIGGGNNYIANLLKKYTHSYTILEPNITNKENDIIYFDKWLEDIDYNYNYNYDITILSHVFEHLYKLEEIFKFNSKYIILSIPYFEKYIDNNFINILNIEHTYYYEKNHIIYYFSRFKYNLIKYFEYNDHSQFFIFEYDKTIKNINLKFINIEDNLTKYYNNIKKYTEKINLFLEKNDKICLFPCNHYVLFFIMFGLNKEKIKYLYDNNIDKNNKYLYGTNIMCKNLDFFIENNNYIILLIGSVYNNEICDNLNKYKIKYKIIL
jgi:hypothetical protein